MRRRAALSVLLLLGPWGWPADAREKLPRRDVGWIHAQLERWPDHAEEASPYRLRARLELLDVNGHGVSGSYLREWASPALWREEIRIGDAVDTEGMNGDVSWSRRPTVYRPWAAMRVAEAFRVEMPDYQRDIATARVFGSRRDRPAMACARVPRIWWCVDAASGSPLFREEPALGIRYDYGPITEFSRGSLPRDVRLMEEDQEVGRVIVEAFDAWPEPDPGRFRPPGGARIRAACVEPRWPQVLPQSKSRPTYPKDALARQEEGFAVLVAEIGTDGSVLEVHCVRATSSAFEQAARQAVSRWKYEPALCGTTPIPMEMIVSVNFEVGESRGVKVPALLSRDP